MFDKQNLFVNYIQINQENTLNNGIDNYMPIN